MRDRWFEEQIERQMIDMGLSVPFEDSYCGSVYDRMEDAADLDQNYADYLREIDDPYMKEMDDLDDCFECF